MPITVDLHLHTTASDGRLTPTQLVELAAAKGLRTISVSDHDTTAGLAEARPKPNAPWPGFPVCASSPASS